MNELVDFYTGSQPDDNGRLLSEILEQDDDWLEYNHDYIQWLFPNKEASGVTPWVPVITKEVENRFREDASLRGQLLTSFRRILAFYGMEISDGRIVKSENWNQRKTNWFTQNTHNNLRITRIIKCLSTLGLEKEASCFYVVLKGLVETELDCGISPSSVHYWSRAIVSRYPENRDCSFT